MGGWKELHIQSNIPLIVLTLSVICIVVIGFLELKKMTHKINELSVEVQNIKKMKIENKEASNLTEENLKMQNLFHEQNNKKEKEVLKHETEQNEEKILEKILEKNIKDQILSEQQIPVSPEELIMGGMGFPPMMQGGLASVILGGGPMMQMGEIHVQNMYDEEIDVQDNIEGDNDFEEIDVQENDDEELVEKQNISDTIIINQPSEDKDIIDDNSSEDDSSVEDSGSDDFSESESDSESDKEGSIILGSGKVEEIKEVDRSLSIKELKEICQKLGVSASGNKETLIKRINSKK